MKISLTNNSYGLLKHIVTYTGEKEIGADGKEVNSQRRLNGEDASQRRFFLKAVDPVMEANSKKYNETVEKAKEDWKKLHPIKKEDKTKYETKMVNELNADKKLMETIAELMKVKADVELTDKTVDFIKKYFKEYGDKNGWLVGDDASVEEVELALK